MSLDLKCKDALIHRLKNEISDIRRNNSHFGRVASELSMLENRVDQMQIDPVIFCLLEKPKPSPISRPQNFPGPTGLPGFG
jgi:hypothetical protein